MRIKTFLLVALLLAPSSLPAQSNDAGRAFTPSDWYRLTNVSSPSMSPDGSMVAFTVTTVREEENERHSEIWMVATSGGEPVRLTSPGTESSNPRWSHDGRYLLFNSRRSGGEGATWALRMDQPATGEAVQLEHWPSGSVPASGAYAVFTASPEEDSEDDGDGVDESSPWAGMPSTARPPHGALTEPEDPARFDGRHIVDLPYKRNNQGFLANPSEPRTYDPSQVFRQAFGDSTEIRITDTDYSHRNATVSPDGRWIAFVADAELRSDSVVDAERDSLALLPYDPVRDEEPRNDADIFLIPLEGGEPTRVTNQNGSEGDLTWSPDSRRLAFVASSERTASDRLWIVDAPGGGEPRELLRDWPFEPNDIEWTDDGYLLMSAAIGGRTALFHVDPETGQRTEVIGDRRRINGFSYDRDHDQVAFVATRVHQPTELFLANIDGTSERRLTGFNHVLNEEIAWPTAERFTYESVDGLEIEAWLQYPHGYQEGQRYPLVLYIHGGPHSAYGEGWFDEFHNITGAGMFVLYTNPRGSGSYGGDFAYSTRGRWGMEDYEDLMRSVDIAIERPDVDPERLGVTGGSYGGFMTAWITTRTDRFKAAQVDRMISNWWSWYGVSDAQGLTEFEFFGKPWENPELYTELSPIAHVGNVTTPTLIVQSEEDHRTPMADAEQWFTALEKQGVPVEFLRYPRSTHDLSRTGEPWLLVDRLARLRQWFSHWLEVAPASTTAVETGERP